jgi:hypothetical protein
MCTLVCVCVGWDGDRAEGTGEGSGSLQAGLLGGVQGGELDVSVLGILDCEHPGPGTGRRAVATADRAPSGCS